MAPAAIVHSYDWTNDYSEMTSRAASAPGQADKLLLSNHSYGYVSGWNYVGDATRKWEWYGNGTTATSIEQDFGRYNLYPRELDSISHAAPYYLIFRAAGNERNDNPAAGEPVALSPGSSTVVSYNPSNHPAGDGIYRNGFETISFDALAKNVITVGSVTDAVTSGTRNPSAATISEFSSWGPTDDGRIKPDVVANGHTLYSPVSSGNSAYATYSGTSMATPNAAGSAALLIHHYGQLFPGGAMRASTLKGLLIHTADDMGNPGPDYKYGWGLVNAKAAADLISDHHTHPEKQRIAEDQLTSTIATRTHPFVWDGSSPIRATLSWTDPAGASTSTSDNRIPRLVNNLDLKLIAPDGTEHLPFVMPFVGTWTVASMDSAATTGINTTDPVEQVLVHAPSTPGVWQAVISHTGTLTNNLQNYSLLIDGAAAEAPPLGLLAIAPGQAAPAIAIFDVTGISLDEETTLTLTAAGQPDIPALQTQMHENKLRVTFDLSSAAPGPWNLLATNTAEETATLTPAITVLPAIWSENFDATPTGWTSQATTGSNSWNLSTAGSQSPATAWFIAAPVSKTTTNLISPVIQIPENITNLQLGFHHHYILQSNQDGGRLELSIDGGTTWFDVQAAGSGASFATNGYNSTINNSGLMASRSEFAGLSAWSGNSGGFIQTIVNLADTSKFAGKPFRMRWRMATNATTSSTGWRVDTVVLSGDPVVQNQPPVILTHATTSDPEIATDPDETEFHLIRTNSAQLHVSADDDAGEANLTYTWHLLSGPAPVSFSPNSNNTAKSTEAGFEAAGDYEIEVSIADAAGLSVTSHLNLRFLPTPTELTIAPSIASLTYGGSQTFTAGLLDQFGTHMAALPPDINWSASGGGSIDTDGHFTAQQVGGPFTIAASTDEFPPATAAVTITPAPAQITLGNLEQTYDGAPKPVTFSTDPTDLAVTPTYNGSATAPTHAGTYEIIASIDDENHQGSETGTLTISKATASITLGNLEQIYDGSSKSVTATSSPADLPITITYDDAAEAPTAIGTYTVIASIDSPNHQGIETSTLTITGVSYEYWKSLEFSEEQILAGDAAPDADADHDGLKNFAEFALGSDPNAFTPQPSFTLEGEFLTLHFTRPKGLSGVTYHAETSSTLGGWQPATMEIMEDTGDKESLRVRVSRPTDGQPLFLRLRFEPTQ